MPLNEKDIGVIKKLIKSGFEDRSKEAGPMGFNPYTADLTAWKDLIMQIESIQPEDPGLWTDNLNDVWYHKFILEYTCNGEEKPEMIAQFYWLGWLLEPIEKFFLFGKNAGKKAAGPYAEKLAKIKSEDYLGNVLDSEISKLEKISYLNKLKGAVEGTPGSTPEEAQHYAGQKSEYSKEMEGKINFAYDHAVLDELGGYAAEEATA